LVHNGYLVVFAVLFLNNIGFPVPGDTVLLAGGFLVGKGVLSFWRVVVMGTAGCFLGGCGGYWFGLRFGRRFLKKITWFRVTPQRLKSMDHFFEKFGPKVVFFARFVALLHPITGLLAGMWKTPLRPFLFYNLAGSAAYAVIYTLVGYFFGQKWEIFKSWIGPVAFYALLIAAALLILFLFLRHSVRSFFDSFSVKKNKFVMRKKKSSVPVRNIPKKN
jgi:membrane protein DedA with SNARE-associated domain